MKALFRSLFLCTLANLALNLSAQTLVVFADTLHTMTGPAIKDAVINLIDFFAHESCGQCTPCRVGCEKAVKLMQADKWDQPLLEELSTVMVDASICGLGQAATNPIRLVMKHFPDEV